MVYVSKRSRLKVFHEPYCPYAKRMIGKYKRNLTEEQARSRGYSECSWCGGIHGTYLRMKAFPQAFPKDLSELGLSYDFENQAICFRTNIGFWKIRWDKKQAGYKLYHLNKESFRKDKTDRELMKGWFHRQVDMSTTKKLGYILKYIVDHDKAKAIMEDDWRKLPKSTKQQRRYYRQAKKRERKKSIQRVDEIFRQLENERSRQNG